MRPSARAAGRAGGRSTYGICQFVLSWQTPVDAPGPVACGIPGYDRPGQEVVTDTFRADDGPLSWNLRGRCGFATNFAYDCGG